MYVVHVCVCVFVFFLSSCLMLPLLLGHNKTLGKETAKYTLEIAWRKIQNESNRIETKIANAYDQKRAEREAKTKRSTKSAKPLSTNEAEKQCFEYVDGMFCQCHIENISLPKQN